MAEMLAVRLGLLASFGGITRIRFKGSSTNRDLSAIRLPRTFTRSYDHKNRSQSRERVIGRWLFVRRSRPTSLRQGYDLASTAAPTTTLDVSTECTEFSE